MDNSASHHQMSTPNQIPEARISSLPSNSTAATSSLPKGDAKITHVLNRLGFGPRPGDIQRVQNLGLQKYIQQQLNPTSISMPGWIEQNIAQLGTLNKSALELYQLNQPRNVRLQKLRKAEKMQGSPGEQKNKMKGARQSKEERLAQKKARVKAVLKNRETETREEQRKIQEQVQLPLNQASEARLIRAVNSPRQLEEVMVNFWFNHFNVSRKKGFGRIWAGIYDEHAIRPYALGAFRELLGATAHHPAMLYYLDNARSRKEAINENYARELLELHTLGVEGGYTQKDVQEVARVFTGWKYVPMEMNSKLPTESDKYPDFYFDQSSHDFGTKKILGKTFDGSGVDEGEQVLDLLASHPSTAKHISYQLAQYFVADNPPSALVSRLAQQFQASKGNIASVLSTLFSSPEFWDTQYFGQKFKTPYEYVISSLRATGHTQIDSRKLSGVFQQLGMPLYGCETPDGYKNVQSAWLSPEGMMRRLSIASSVPSGVLGQAEQTLTGSQLSQTLGNISTQTWSVIQKNPPQLQAAAILGSPEMMMR